MSIRGRSHGFSGGAECEGEIHQSQVLSMISMTCCVIFQCESCVIKCWPHLPPPIPGGSFAPVQSFNPCRNEPAMNHGAYRYRYIYIYIHIMYVLCIQKILHIYIYIYTLSLEQQGELDYQWIRGPLTDPCSISQQTSVNRRGWKARQWVGGIHELNMTYGCKIWYNYL